MDEQVKQRVVGAGVLSLIAAILLPLMFGDPRDPRDSIRSSFDGEAQRLPTPATPSPMPVAQFSEVPASTPAIVNKAKPQATARPKPVATNKPKATPKPKVTSKPQTSSGKKQWILQLASYKQKEAAARFLETLRKSGESAYLETVKISGKTYYRVRVKYRGSKESAQKRLRGLERKHRLKAQLLPAR